MQQEIIDSLIDLSDQIRTGSDDLQTSLIDMAELLDATAEEPLEGIDVTAAKTMIEGILTVTEELEKFLDGLDSLLGTSTEEEEIEDTEEVEPEEETVQ